MKKNIYYRIWVALRWRLSIAKSAVDRLFPFIRWVVAPISYKRIAIIEKITRKNFFSHRCENHFIPSQCRLKIAVVAHLYRDELADEFTRYFKNISTSFDAHISTHLGAAQRLQTLFESSLPNTRVFVRAVENRGRDMGPFAVIFRDVYPQYDLVCWVHSKTSSHDRHYLLWRRYLLRNLLGSNRIIDNILCDFQNNSDLGLVFPEIFPVVRNWMNWDANFNNVQFLLNRMGIPIQRGAPIDFPAGSMFWFRPKALEPLFKIGLSLDDFEPGSENMLDGTMAHAIERVLLLATEKSGFTWKKVLFAT